MAAMAAKEDPGPGDERNTITYENHKKRLLDNLTEFWKQKFMCDVTIQTDDGSEIQAHRNILASGSTYFKDIFQKYPDLEILPLKEGFDSEQVFNVIDFIYKGEIKIQPEGIERFYRVASAKLSFCNCRCSFSN